MLIVNMWYVVTILLSFSLARAQDTTRNSSAKPLSIPPSLYFDGNDGSWSTYHVRIGNPPQTVKLLPGTSASAGDTVWVVLEEGCSQANPNLTDCASDRGQVFTRNESTTWSTQRLSNEGLYQLNTFEEGKLGLTGNAYYGFDTVRLGLDGSGLPSFENQLVASYADNNYWLGSLPMSPIPFNISDLNTPIPSILGRMRNDSTVPSASWGYTAGAAYQDPPVYGSLTFGGYDASRFDNSTILRDVPFGNDFSRDLVVQLESITYDTIGSSPLLTEEVYIFIDSMVSQLWLPVNVCQAFATAFNLTWDNTTSLYLINEAQHNALVKQNPTFTFSLVSTGNSSSTVAITLPYAAFDLNISYPFVSTEQRYFPLKRASDPSQYTLGRVFLQEAYIIADYERSNFSVAQATFPASSAPQNLIAIEQPSELVLTKGNTGSSGIGGGAIAGIVVGAIVLIALIVTAVLTVRRRRAKKARGPATVATEAEGFLGDEKRLPDETTSKGPIVAELGHHGERFEADSSARMPNELDGQDKHRMEMDGTGTPRNELDANDRDKPHTSFRHELRGSEGVVAELEALGKVS
jgi:hypothetical protein